MEANSPSRRWLIETLILLFSSLLTVASSLDWKDCDGMKMFCVVHSSCLSDSEPPYYAHSMNSFIKNKNCKQYIRIKAKSPRTIEIDFRESSISRTKGFEVLSKGRASPLWSCVNNVASSTEYDIQSASSDSSTELNCKFDLSLKIDSTANILNSLEAFMPWTIKESEVKINTFPIRELFLTCQWKSPLFTTANAEVNATTEQAAQLTNADDPQAVHRRCPAGFSNMYKSAGSKDWETIGNFICDQGKIMYPWNGGLHVADLVNGKTKCTRNYCNFCTCPFCRADREAPNPTLPYVNNIKTDGVEGTCVSIHCSSGYPLITLSSGDIFVDRERKSLECSKKSRTPLWHFSGTEDKLMKVQNMSCLSKILCTQIYPISTQCPKIGTEGYDCSQADLNDRGDTVCKSSASTVYQPKGADKSIWEDGGFWCDNTTGVWRSGTSGEQALRRNTGAVLYCLQKHPPRQ